MEKIDKKEFLEHSLENIFGFLSIKPNYTLEENEDVIKIQIDGKDLNFLIGFKGESLDAMQKILGLMLLREYDEFTPLHIDINDYKDRKTEKLEEIAKRYIDKVRFFESEVVLPPMKAWERRQIHMFVSEYDDIVSESEGVGKNRKIVLKPSKQ